MAAVADSIETDVLILGAGPTGLMAALWMAELGIKTRIVDKRGTRILNGHADGFHTRSVEIFDSFGMSEPLLKNSSSFLEYCVWAPSPQGGLHRMRKEPSVGSLESRFQSSTVHQGCTEAILLDNIRKRSEIEIERGTEPKFLHVDQTQIDNPDAYPITLALQHLKAEEIEGPLHNAHTIEEDGSVTPEPGFISAEIGAKGSQDITYHPNGKEGQFEVVRAKYLLGCEGAHSWTRQQLGFKKEGVSTNEAWGVIDIMPITNFPDVRKQCAIQTMHGAMLIVPRENGLVRLYIELRPEDAENGQYAPADLMNVANRILTPYEMRYTYCDWWTIFRVGRRISDHYTFADRVFLAGDAVHSHTPKGGQGMNVSMQDAFNLGWKIAGVVNGYLHPSILPTYEAERRPIAQELMDLDQDLGELLAGRLGMEESMKVFQRCGIFMSGANVCYESNMSIAAAAPSPSTPASDDDGYIPISDDKNGADVDSSIAKPHLAKNILIGKRLPSAQVLLHANACFAETQSILKSDGSWRLLVFGGDVSNESQLDRVNNLGQKIANLSPLAQLTTTAVSEARDVPLLQVNLIHGADPASNIELSEFHETYFPFDQRKGYDYNRVYTDVPPEFPGRKPGNNAHDTYGIDTAWGCVVVTRPDQHVGYIGNLEDTDSLAEYFGRIFTLS